MRIPRKLLDLLLLPILHESLVSSHEEESIDVSWFQLLMQSQGGGAHFMALGITDCSIHRTPQRPRRSSEKFSFAAEWCQLRTGFRPSPFQVVLYLCRCPSRVHDS